MGRVPTLIVCALVSAALPTGAEAAKKKKPKKLPKPTTASRTESSSAHGQLVTATARCPKRMVVTGGGFEAPADVNGADVDSFNLYEARRNGARDWTVSAIRVDQGADGDPLPLTAVANCRSAFTKSKVKRKGKGKRKKKRKTKLKKLKLKEASSSAMLVGGQTGSVTATCRDGHEAVGGGFTAFPAPSAAPPSLVLFGESRRAGPGAWTAKGINVGADRTIFAFAYCVKGAAVREVSASAPIAEASVGVFPTGSARTGSCPKKRSLSGGGFENPGAGPPPLNPLALATSNRQSGAVWRADGINAGGPATSINAFGYCI